jgi:hypothetical protein
MTHEYTAFQRLIPLQMMNRLLTKHKKGWVPEYEGHSALAQDKSEHPEEDEQQGPPDPELEAEIEDLKRKVDKLVLLRLRVPWKMAKGKGKHRGKRNPVPMLPFSDAGQAAFLDAGLIPDVDVTMEEHADDPGPDPATRALARLLEGDLSASASRQEGGGGLEANLSDGAPSWLRLPDIMAVVPADGMFREFEDDEEVVSIPDATSDMEELDPELEELERIAFEDPEDVDSDVAIDSDAEGTVQLYQARSRSIVRAQCKFHVASVTDPEVAACSLDRNKIKLSTMMVHDLDLEDVPKEEFCKNCVFSRPKVFPDEVVDFVLGKHMTKDVAIELSRDKHKRSRDDVVNTLLSMTGITRFGKQTPEPGPPGPKIRLKGFDRKRTPEPGPPRFGPKGFDRKQG